MVADIGHFALSLSRTRQCCKPARELQFDKTHERATVRQCDKTGAIATVKFCRTVALSPVLSYTVALSCVLSHRRSLVRFCRTVVGVIATVRNVLYQPPYIPRWYPFSYLLAPLLSVVFYDKNVMTYSWLSINNVVGAKSATVFDGHIEAIINVCWDFNNLNCRIIPAQWYNTSSVEPCNDVLTMNENFKTEKWWVCTFSSGAMA